MIIKFIPQRSDEQLQYEFDNDIITAIYYLPITKEIEVMQEVDGKLLPVVIEDEEGNEIPLTEIVTEYEEIREIFDFTDMPDGKMEEVYIEHLPHSPILKAERVDGILRVELLNFYQYGASNDVLFPEWKEVLKEEPVGEDDLIDEDQVEV